MLFVPISSSLLSPFQGLVACQNFTQGLFGVNGRSGLQITCGNRTLSDQNLLVSDKISPGFRHYVWRIFFIINHFMVRINKNLPLVNLTLLVS